MTKNVYVSGSFDLFHIGHVNVIKQAKNLCGVDSKLVVGVHTDESVLKRKDHLPVIPFEQRFQIIQALKDADIVVKLDGFDQFEDQIEKYDIGTWCIGDDYAGKFDYLSKLCNVVYLKRTPNVSTTLIREKILKEGR